MAGSVNKAIIIGNLGQDPEIRSMQSGDKIANLSIATSKSWKDKATGERKENTQWHRIVIFNQGLVGICEKYLRKGQKVYVEGQIETRSWEQDGQKKYTTEIVLRPFSGELNMLSSPGDGNRPPPNENYNPEASIENAGYNQDTSKPPGTETQVDELEDEIPF